MNPAVTGIIETSLYVEDLDRSLHFYSTLFGFAEITRGERLVALNVANRHLLLLFKKGASTELPHTPHDATGQIHIAFSITADALEDWQRWLDRHQIPILERKTWDYGGVSLYFRDPDGHLLEVATPGVWPSVF